MAHYTNFVVNDRPGLVAGWQIAAITLITLVFVQFLHDAERGAVRFQCYDPWMGQGGCGVLVPLLSDFRRRVDNHGFTSFVIGCSFDSDRAHLAYIRSAEVYCSSIDGGHGWLSYSSAAGLVKDLAEGFFRHGREMEVGRLV